MSPRSDNIPDRCLVCYASVRANTGRKKKASLIEKEKPESLFSKQLDVMFILRNLLEIPSQNLQIYLMSWGNPDAWISICPKCNVIIEDARRIHVDMVETFKRFGKIKEQVVEAIKKSKTKQNIDHRLDLWRISNRIITDQSRDFVSIHEYGFFTDPFISGDRRARQLIKKPLIEGNTETIMSNVKTEVDTHYFLEDYIEEGLQFDAGIAIESLPLDDHQYNEELELYDENEVDHSADMDTPLTSDNHVDLETKSEEKPIQTKFCDRCHVTLLAKMFEQHVEYIHKSGPNPTEAVMEDESIKPTVESGILEDPLKLEGNMTSEENRPPSTEDDNQIDIGTNAIHQQVGKSNTFNCLTCPRKFYHRKDILDHQDLHKTSPFHCSCCLSVHKNHHNLRFHMWKHHPSTRTRKNNCLKAKKNSIEASQIDQEPTSASSAKVKNVKCSKCRLYIRPALMGEHLELHEKSPYRCKICENVYETDRKLALHLGKYHRSLYDEYRKNKKSKKYSTATASQISEPSNEIAKTERRKSSRESSRKTREKFIAEPSPGSSGLISDSDSDVEKSNNDQDDEWDPTHQNVSKVTSSPMKGTKRKQHRQFPRKKKFLECMYCLKFRFKILEVDKLLAHWGDCSAIQSNENDERDNIPLNCPLCANYKVTFADRIAYCEHLMACNENHEHVPISCRIFECNICPSKAYFTLESFLKHYVEHSRNIFKCTRCPQKFPVTSHVTNHWKNHHKDALRTVQPLYRFTKEISVPEYYWWCKFCNEKFSVEDERDEHIHNAHNLEVPKKLHVCQECSKAYACADELRLHQGTVHAPNRLNVMTCDVCKQRFATAVQLKDHKMRKHRLDLLVCETCGMECNSVHNLRTHMQLHQEKKQYPCQQCEQSFTTRQYLRNHTFREHAPLDAKINPLVCPYCDKAFNNKSYLNEHVAGIHQGQFKMYCEVCNAGFHHNSQLKKHLARKHEIGERKRYPCTIPGCDKTFGCPAHLKNHLTRHSGNPRFRCQYCEKAFYNKTHLRRHELIHTNSETKPYQCEICAKRFPVRNYLYIHMKSHKNDNK